MFRSPINSSIPAVEEVVVDLTPRTAGVLALMTEQLDISDTLASADKTTVSCNSTDGTVRSFLQGGHQTKLRVPGRITRCRAEFEATADITSIKFTVYRWDGSAWDTIGQSEEISSGWSNGVSTFDLATPITGVQAGDNIAIRITATDTDSQMWCQKNRDLQDHDTFWNNGETVGNDQAFGNPVNGWSYMLDAWGDTPAIAIAGDSMAAAHDLAFGPYETLGSGEWEANDYNTLGIAAELNILNSTLNAVNIGWGGTSTETWTWNGTDLIVPVHPRAAVMLFGANDITSGNTFTQSLANIDDLVGDLTTNDIIPIFATIPQMSTFSAANKLAARAWNKSLKAWCNKNGWLCIDVWRLHASAGDPDTRMASFGTGSHPNADGYKAIAAAINSHIVTV